VRSSPLLRKLILDVVAGDLVFERRRAATEDADLGWRSEIRHGDDAPGVDPCRGERRGQCPARLVVADGADYRNHRSEGCEVGERVRAAAGYVALFLVPKDDHRRLAGDPLGGTKDETVEHQITVERDPGVGEAVDDLEKLRSVAHGAAECIAKPASESAPASDAFPPVQSSRFRACAPARRCRGRSHL